jgi:hypothetical protein
LCLGETPYICARPHSRLFLVRIPPGQFSNLEFEGELDGAGAADLVEGVKAAVRAAGTEAARQRLRGVPEERIGQVVVGIAEVGVVEDVEELGSETQAQLLRQRKAPLKSYIRLRGSESTQDVASAPFAAYK